MTAGRSDSEPRRWNVAIALAAIGVAHLPFVALELRTLWLRDHYQFFPFALGMFAWLLYTRRLPGVFKWDRWNTVLLLADITCLVAAVTFFNDSRLVVFAGGLLFLLTLCRGFQDRDYQCSLSYLFLLPLITLRPPLNFDLDAINWLQRATTGVASQLLNFFGFLHLRMGNILEFPGKRFLVEEACSGVQSLFTLLFLAALVICGYRRRWLHAVVVLVSAACLAGVMNVLRICAVTVAWSTMRLDLSSGWQHDLLGYAALVVAGLLVLSADAACEFFLSPVPDPPGVGAQSIFRNPFATVWRACFHRSPRSATEGLTDPAIQCGPATVCVASVASVGLLTLQLMSL